MKMVVSSTEGFRTDLKAGLLWLRIESATSSNFHFGFFLMRSHAVEGALYWTRRTGKDGCIIFVPTDRDEPDYYVWPTINVTMLRKTFLSIHTATRQFHDERKHQVLNIDLLATYLRLDYRWMENWTWRHLVEHQNAEDDMRVERMKKEKKSRKKKDDEEAGKRPKRRSSIALGQLRQPARSVD